jgi:putative FmdB family regulatory protein
MPLYEYECQSCRETFELIQKFSDPPAEHCPRCGGPVTKLLSSPAIQFKGTGWYVTDYARKGTSAGSKSESGSAAGSSESSSEGSKGSETKASETKASDTKSGKTE